MQRPINLFFCTNTKQYEQQHFMFQKVDASLIAMVNWWALAIHDETLVKCTMEKEEGKLQGKCGFKHFLRDGYGTMLGDRSRKYYKPAEIKVNTGIIRAKHPFVRHRSLMTLYSVTK